MPFIIPFLPAIASAVTIGAGVNSIVQSRTGTGAQAGADAAAASDPFSGEREQYQIMLQQMFPDLLKADPSAIEADPAYQFEKEQGVGAINDMASAGGLLRSGNRLTDLAKFSSGLASKYTQQQFNNKLSVASLLSRLAGADSGSPGAAGNAILAGQNRDISLLNNGVNSITGAMSTFARGVQPWANGPGTDPITVTPGG